MNTLNVNCLYLKIKYSLSYQDYRLLVDWLGCYSYIPPNQRDNNINKNLFLTLIEKIKTKQLITTLDLTVFYYSLLSLNSYATGAEQEKLAQKIQEELSCQ